MCWVAKLLVKILVLEMMNSLLILGERVFIFALYSFNLVYQTLLLSLFFII